MPLSPAISDRLHLLEGINRQGAGLQELLATLAIFNGTGEGWSAPRELTITDRKIVGPHGVIPIRLYEPESPSSTFVLWAHGGGFAAGTLDWPEAHVASAELAARSGATVVSVDYRLAGPDTRYPIPLDDVSAALAWTVTLAHKSVEQPIVATGGASAGAALVLAAALRDPASVDALLLCYPFLHFPVPILPFGILHEMHDLPPILRFPAESVESMVMGYVGRIHDLPPDALPGAATVPSGMPPTYILLAEYDDLRPSGELLARQYQEAGVPVTTRLEPGVLHGHLNRHPGEPGVDESLDWLAGIVRSMSR